MLFTLHLFGLRQTFNMINDMTLLNVYSEEFTAGLCSYSWNEPRLIMFGIPSLMLRYLHIQAIWCCKILSRYLNNIMCTSGFLEIRHISSTPYKLYKRRRSCCSAVVLLSCDYNCDSTMIRLRSDYDVSRAPASIHRDSTRAKNEHVDFSS